MSESILTENVTDTQPAQAQDGITGAAETYPEQQGGPGGEAAPHESGGGESTRVVLSEEYRNIPSLKKYMDEQGRVDPNVLAKSYINAESMIGRERIPIPKDENDTETLEKAWSALGRPASPDEYKLDREGIELPEGMEYDEEGEAYLRQLSHQNGFNNRQVKALRDAYLKREAERTKNYQEYLETSRQSAEESLRREQGHNYDNFIRTAKVALREYGDPDFYDYLNKSGMGNDPRLIRIFGKVGQQMIGENRLKEGMGPGEGPGDIDQTISEFREKHHTALMDKHHHEHDRRSQELSRLYQRKFPE